MSRTLLVLVFVILYLRPDFRAAIGQSRACDSEKVLVTFFKPPELLCSVCFTPELKSCARRGISLTGEIKERLDVVEAKAATQSAH
jgi:hypothetical protein